MGLHWIPLLLVWTAISMVSVHGAFEGYKTILISPVMMSEIQKLQEMNDEFVGLDFWTPLSLSQSSRIVLPPSIFDQVTDKLDENGILWQHDEFDLPRLVKASIGESKTAGLKKPGQIVDHMRYHNYSEIVSLLHALKKKFPANMDIYYLPHKTYKGKKVITVKLFGEACTSTKTIIAEAGIHAREWITPAATLYIIDTLLNKYHEGDINVQMMLDTYDWHFVPVANPDGYDFTHEKPENRMWRKNRKPTTGDCVGVDLNRNFDIKFGTLGTSSNCESPIYSGPEAFSEAETANLRDMFLELNSTAVAYLSIHSFNQYLITPWGYIEDYTTKPGNFDELERVANMMAEKIMTGKDKRYYLVGAAFNIFGYGVSGASEDWVLTQKPSMYAYCIEMSPSWDDIRGFLLPPEEIVSASEDLWIALKVLASEINV